MMFSLTKKTSLLSCACIIMVSLLLLVALVPSITAVHFHSVTFLVNRATGRTLDSNDKGDVYAIGMNGGGFQKWYIHGDGDTFDLTNAQTGRVLDSDHNGKVYTLPYNAGHHQKWRMQGEFFQNVATGRYLDSDHKGQVYTLPHNGGGFQQWAAHHEVKF